MAFAKAVSADLRVIHGPHVIHFFSLPCLLQHAPVRLDEAAGAGRPTTMLRASSRERRPLWPAAHVALPPAREGGRGSSGARARSADRRRWHSCRSTDNQTDGAEDHEHGSKLGRN